MYRKLYFIGIIPYLFLLVLTLVFYKERAIFLDCSYMIFQMVRTGSFCIEVYRFGDAIAQSLPFLSYKAGLSLANISRVYSLGLMLVPFVCYLLCGCVLKQYRLALVVLVVNMLFVTHTFYWAQSQVPQGMALFMVIFSLLWGRNAVTLGIVRWAVVIALLVMLAFFHPLMSLVLVYAVLFFTASDYKDMSSKVLSILLCVFFAALMIKSVFFRTEYERHSLSGLKNVVRLFPNYLTLYANGRFFKNCLTVYCWIPVTFAAIASVYVVRKEFKKLALLMFTVPCYILLVNIMYPDAQTPVFYIENMYLPVALFLGMPLIFDLVPMLEQKKVAMPALLLVMLCCSIRVFGAHADYTARLEWERTFLKENGERKIIADAKTHQAGLLQMLWGTPYEFWLLSTIEQGRSASIIIDDDPPHRDWAKNKTKELVVNWNVFPYRDLNPQYFRYSDTTTGYIIETPQLAPNP